MICAPQNDPVLLLWLTCHCFAFEQPCLSSAEVKAVLNAWQVGILRCSPPISISLEYRRPYLMLHHFSLQCFPKTPVNSLQYQSTWSDQPLYYFLNVTLNLHVIYSTFLQLFYFFIHFRRTKMRLHRFSLLIIMVLVSTSTVIQTKTQRGDKMLRLCLWTHCRSSSSPKKCPVYLEQSAVRKCKLETGEIGFYSKCCFYEEPFHMQKTSAANS